MKVQFTRTDASQWAVRLYERPLHPELFRNVAQARLKHDAFIANFHLCESGHTVDFRYNNETLTEVIGPYDQDLPERGRCFGYRLRGSRDAAHTLKCGLQYHCAAQVEQLEAELFWELHAEMEHDAKRAFLSFEYPGGHRFAPTPLSLIKAELTSDSLGIQAFHTFPESLSILRTQSLIEF